MAQNNRVVIEVAIEGIDALVKLGERVDDIAKTLEQLSDITDRLFSMCDYCGESVVVGVPCSGCGRMSRWRREDNANP